MTPGKTIAILDRMLRDYERRMLPDRFLEQREALAESLAMWRRLQNSRSKPKERIDAKDQT
jgi:hypothetical protein